MNQDAAMKLVLQEWADEAEQGKPSDFRGWTFFETNCLSELVKLTRTGSARAVQAFLRDRDILLTGPVLSEISAVPDIARDAETMLSTAHVFLVPDVTKFLDCDFWNFISEGRSPRNVLEAVALPADLLSGMLTHGRFLETVKTSRASLEIEYAPRVKPDVGAGLNERQLLALIWSRINSMAQETYKIELPTADARPDRFPAFFTFHYAYYFRYVKSHGVKVQTNDFNDLSNTLAAPYCRDFFTEKTLAGILRNDLQGRVPPRPIEVASGLRKRGLVSTETFKEARATEAQTAANEPLLANCRIWTINDLREQVVAAAAGSTGL